MSASLSGLLTADHGEETALAAPAQQHPELNEDAIEGGATGTRDEQPLIGRKALGGHALGDALDELDAGLVEPAEDLVESVLRLVRVLVLVHEPRTTAGRV